ncbi:hypothetical protein LEL_09868 [Akanthomyces lecanii RCEF 1005]|uniref:Uncharacterized protein n=1 Tax=Akanthomyces lecanii RCEF 1005 TaxID=1081108 RepID=A0A162JJW3_CORDF|nr:hypothetical protein LEL_09868 [Akanthomyces lecanii RCEF 1005]
MALFVELEAEDDGGDAQNPSSRCSAPPPAEAVESMTPTLRSAVTDAFHCYPIVAGIVSHLDLTTLDSLARTSRAIHRSLIQSRAAILATTLRCSKENVSIDTKVTLQHHANHANHANDAHTSAGSRHPADASKASRCARDMNCAFKPPAMNQLRERHRRLCTPCAKAPLKTVAWPSLDLALPRGVEMMQRSLCDCESAGVWLCQPCGRTIRNADSDYIRIWRWRTHYGETLGCLGTGIGDADRGVICGREERCLAAREREQEIDCDAEDARSSRASSSSSSSSDHPTTPSSGNNHHHASSYFPVVASSSYDSHPIEHLKDEAARERTPSPLLLGPGYARHEIEGIGGIVKRKLVRMVRVGKCVPEWEEERSAGRVLGREIRREARSWCGWCWRVVPGHDDRLPTTMPVPAASTQNRPPVVSVVRNPADSVQQYSYRDRNRDNFESITATG